MTAMVPEDIQKHNSLDTTAQNVPLRTGPPTREELNVYYPAKFTWDQLKTFVNSGDLGLLKRDRQLQKRYNLWAVGIKEQYGSVVNYLLNFRLQWGKADNLSLLTSELDTSADGLRECHEDTRPKPIIQETLPPMPADAPPYFTSSTPSEYISIIQNDWPYSGCRPEIEHTLVWTRSVSARIDQDGLWGFTGLNSPPPSPSTLPSCLPALADWGITMEKLIRSQKGTTDEEVMVQRAGAEVQEYVKKRWAENEWETAWFVNPPRLQSVLGLAHVHVFARKKL
ncbi:hypothetical protein BD779DRAFT_1606266 [Infundibulicybe gibba]|nr:hypothetical protein BD779DRAFT_1606266 [Infundibulicybe gibba]